MAYGAPGKGNTLLNHCGIRSDLVEFSVDRNPLQARQVPAGHAHPDPSRRSALAEARPDYVLIMPWNLREEIARQLELRPRLGRRGSSSPCPQLEIF